MQSRRQFVAGLDCCSLAAVAKAGGRSFPEGFVSLTYDDGLESQLDHAVPALNARGPHGTFYVTWENIEERVAEWHEVAEQGHEVANHTMTHPCDIGRLSTSQCANRSYR